MSKQEEPTKKFKYYITDLFDGSIVGTNDETKARDYTVSDDHFVVDAERGVWLLSDEEVPVKDLDGE
jgi:hypothetical protein